MLCLRQLSKLALKKCLTTQTHQFKRSIFTTASEFICVSEEVREAVSSGRAVVALESTILTHGLPPDRALKLAADAEATLRSYGAIPATVAVMDSRIRVGLSSSDIERLIDASIQGNAKKVAIRDLPFALNCKDSGRVFGTTVSATSFAANLSGVRVFATGGTGGVHRGAETSMDVSSDLLALQSLPVAVVSAGVKSILDIPKTLEVLEAKGVTIASVGTDTFPAFFTRNSGCKSPGRVDTPEEAANLFATSLAIRPTSGMLVAVPIPENMQAVGETIAQAIEQALNESKKANISGADVTPFMLERVRQLTGDASLEANVHLVLNNAKFAAQTAVRLAELLNGSLGNRSRTSKENSPQIIIVGGSNVDMAMKLKPEKLKTTRDIYPPASYPGTLEILGGGGVGRNVAEAVGRLFPSHLFLTAVSNDSEGKNLFKNHPFISWKTAPTLISSSRTAKYIGVLNPTGELLFGVADMDIHKQVTAEFVESELQNIESPDLKVIFSDGNVDVKTLKKLTLLAQSHKVPFWYEPTDLHKCTKIIDANKHGSPIDAISPNLTELKAIFERVVGKKIEVDPTSTTSLTRCASEIKKNLLNLAANWVVKMGRHGVIFVNQDKSYHFTSPVVDQASIASVSGAGDTSVGAMLYLHYIKNWPWKKTLIGGMRAAELSLGCKNPVPDTLSISIFENEYELEKWSQKIKISEL
nr:pseudouridine metabolizing bifunctional protein [Hymenolepis microstoma]